MAMACSCDTTSLRHDATASINRLGLLPGAITQRLDHVVVALGAFELAQHHGVDFLRQVLLERLAIALQRGVLAPLAFGEHGLVAGPAEQARGCESRRGAPPRSRCRLAPPAAQPLDLLLQFGRGLAAILGTAPEQRAQARRLRVLRRFAKSQFAIAGVFQQLVQRRDHLLGVALPSVVNSRAFSARCHAARLAARACSHERLETPLRTVQSLAMTRSAVSNSPP